MREAGQLARELRGVARVELKSDNTLVTEADRAVEMLLRERLGALAPDYAFLGEETGLTGSPDAPCWVIDPIDGTTNFVRDIPLWCISVGLVYGGRAIFGTIDVAPLHQTFWAASGAGAFKQTGEQTLPLKVPDSDSLMQEDLLVCNTTVEHVVDFSGVPCRQRNFGSLAYHLAVAAQGSVAASISHWHQLYDIAAGVCICEEAGCRISYVDGGEWTANALAPRETRPLMAAPPRRMAYLLDRLTLR